MKWIVAVAVVVVVALLVPVLGTEPLRPGDEPRGADPTPRREAPVEAVAPVSAASPPAAGARIAVSEAVAIELIGVDASGAAFATRMAGPAGADGRVPIHGEVEHSHRIDELVASRDYILFARGYLPTRIPAGTRFERAQHRVTLTRALTLRFLIEGAWDHTGQRVTMALQPDTRAMPPEEARIAALSHRTIAVTQRVFEVERTGTYGGKAVFTVLDTGGRPIGAGPVVDFGAEDGDVVVSWEDSEWLSSTADLSLQLTFDRAAPSGDLKLELCPSVLDVLRRIRFRREPGAAVVQLFAESLPLGDYEVTLVASDRRSLLGKVSLSESERAATMHVGRPATLQVVAPPGDEQVKSIRLYDVSGRLVDAWLPAGGEGAEACWPGLGPGTYWFVAVGENGCSRPEQIELHAGEVVVRDVVLVAGGGVRFTIADGGDRVVMARQAGRQPVALLCVDGATCRLPAGAWEFEVDGVAHRVEVEAGRTVSLTL